MGRFWVDCGSQPPADTDTAALRPIRNTGTIRALSAPPPANAERSDSKRRFRKRRFCARRPSQTQRKHRCANAKRNDSAQTQKAKADAAQDERQVLAIGKRKGTQALRGQRQTQTRTPTILTAVQPPRPRLVPVVRRPSPAFRRCGSHSRSRSSRSSEVRRKTMKE